MSVIAIRSVGLSATTTDAWKAAGVAFSRRGRTTTEILRMGYDHILNLGKSTFSPDEADAEEHYLTSNLPLPTLWNQGVNIKPLLWPGASRELLGDLMPYRPTEYPASVWIKAPGAHGRGKFKKSIDHELMLPKEWDWQNHVEGQEYRIITVGHKVVQDLLRHGENGDRTYEWIRMREVPQSVKAMARLAASRIPGNNVLAWDIIQTDDGQNFLFEGNTCPGVNEHSASRIVAEMENVRNG